LAPPSSHFIGDSEYIKILGGQRYIICVAACFRLVSRLKSNNKKKKKKGA
jgi:hypothetical protein